ncbi:MAG: MFS transporter, partial [Eubacteriaceae bacterium]|nr:MFS transporter [Eubacteriaceae bacterium]
YSMTTTISDILGNAIGGLMYVLVGPPVVFTINGISYIVSAVLEGFIDYKHTRKPFERSHLTQDFKEGLGYIWKVKGLFYMIIIGGLVNLFSDTGIMLTLPYFSDADFLGITKYGIAMGIFQLGAFFGVFFLSSFRIKEKFNFRYFMTAGMVYSGSYIVMMNLNNYIGMLLMFFVAGLCTSIYNIIFTTSIHMNVPGSMLGKVSAIIGTVIGGLTPAGMALGGIIAEYMSVKWVIIYCFLFTGISFGLFGMVEEFVRYINNEHIRKDERQIQKDGIAP